MATKTPTVSETDLKATENQDKTGVQAGVKAEEPAKPKYTKEELQVIFDSIIFEGEYSETVTIRNKLKVTFRARSAEDTMAITREIDAKNFTLISTLNEHRSIMNLVYSLVSYSGRDYSKTSIEDRKKFINGLPAVVVGALSGALVEFDGKIALACQDGEENF